MGGCYADEAEHVIGGDDLRLAQDRIAKGHIHPEALTVELARELALGAEAHAVVLHAVVLDLGVVVVGPHLEREEVAEVQTRRLL